MKEYRGLFWRFEEEDIVWRIIEDNEETGNVWIFNALIYSLNECYNEIAKDRDFQYDDQIVF